MTQADVTDGRVCYDRAAHQPCAACLPAGTHIVLIGDSTMRYMYMTLALALAQGVDRFDRNLVDRAFLNGSRYRGVPWSAASWSSGKGPTGYMTYYSRMRRLLMKANPNAVEWCDCYRREDASGKPRFSDVWDHHYLSLHGVKLTYISNYGTLATKGVWWPGEPDERRTVHDGGYRTNAAWELKSVKQIVEVLLPLLAPTQVIFHTGGHHTGPLIQSREQASELRSAFERAGLGGAAHYSTITPGAKELSRSTWQQNVEMETRPLREAFPVVDTAALVAKSIHDHARNRSSPAEHIMDHFCGLPPGMHLCESANLDLVWGLMRYLNFTSCRGVARGS